MQRRARKVSVRTIPRPPGSPSQKQGLSTWAVQPLGRSAALQSNDKSRFLFSFNRNARTVLVKVEQLLAAKGKDATEKKRHDALGVRLGVGQRQCRAWTEEGGKGLAGRDSVRGHVKGEAKNRLGAGAPKIVIVTYPSCRQTRPSCQCGASRAAAQCRSPGAMWCYPG